MPVEPMEPEDRVSLTEIMLGLVAAVISAPGVIWWALTLWNLVS
jgi:hypothetical protein